MKSNLTKEQIEALAPYEVMFRTAVNASWCSYPGQAGIDKMLSIWNSITGSPYPYKRGCGNCLLNLVRDMGNLYFAAKAAETPAEPAEPEKKAEPAKKAPRRRK